MKKRAFTLAELGLIFFIMAILAVIFYKTLRPERIVYTHLYYSAYEQLLDAYAEVKAYYIAPRSDGANFLGEDTVYRSGKTLDLQKFSDIFNKKLNFVGQPARAVMMQVPGEDGANVNETVDYNVNDYNFYIFGDAIDAESIFAADTSTLTNGMSLKMNIFVDGSSLNQIIIATVDINGTNPPNIINKDIVQFEISDNGVMPVGELEENADMLAFDIVSKYVKAANPGWLNMTDEYIVKDGSNEPYRNLSYKDAACKANVPIASHNYTKNSDGTRTKNCMTTNNQIISKISFCDTDDAQRTTNRGQLKNICTLRPVKPENRTIR